MESSIRALNSPAEIGLGQIFQVTCMVRVQPNGVGQKKLQNLLWLVVETTAKRKLKGVETAVEGGWRCPGLANKIILPMANGKP